MDNIAKEVLKEIKPSAEEEKTVKSVIKEFLDILNKNLKDAKAQLGGSGEKGTWLSKTFDVDVFVLFDASFKGRSAELSDILEPALKKSFGKIDRLHGSRDYFQVQYKGYSFEIVPIIRIAKAKDAVNITDISPLHAKWVLKHKKFQDDIRLLKRFCKANHVYGAESYIKGLSGYICEILTIKFKGFKGVIREAPKLKVGDVIDVEKHYRNRIEVFREMNQSKLTSPVIIIDPVQKTRNAGAALSLEKFKAFQDACREYQRHPSKDLFEIRKTTVEGLSKLYSKKKLVMLKCAPLEGKDDIVGGKLMKAFEYMGNQSELYGFKLAAKGWEWERGSEALFWFVADKDLDKVEKRKGPPVRSKHFVEDFKKKHKDTFVEGKFIFAKVDRDYSSLYDFISHMAQDSYVKERAMAVKVLG